MFKFFAVRHTNKPSIDEPLMTISLQDAGDTLSVFMMPLAEGTENPGATRLGLSSHCETLRSHFVIVCV